MRMLTRARVHYLECPKCESCFRVDKSVTSVPAHKCWAEEKEKVEARILGVLNRDEPITKLELATAVGMHPDDVDFELALVGLWPKKLQLWARDTSGDEPGLWQRPGDAWFPREQPRELGYTLGSTTF